ncbi:DUF6814 family protein [Paenibacillus arenosi]
MHPATHTRLNKTSNKIILGFIILFIFPPLTLCLVIFGYN